MDQSALIAYFAAVAAVTAAPGPLVAVVAARSLDRDERGAFAFVAGICLGDALAILAIAVGLGAWAEGRPEWLAAARWAGAGYLLWTARGIWLDSGRAGAAAPARRGLLLSAGAGAALCLGNPATFFFQMTLLPSVAPAGASDAGRLALAALVAVAAVGAALGLVILLARRAQRLVASPEASARFGRAMALCVGGAALWLLAL